MRMGTSRRNLFPKLVFFIFLSSFIFSGVYAFKASKIGDLWATDQSGRSVILSEEELFSLLRSEIRAQTA